MRLRVLTDRFARPIEQSQVVAEAACPRTAAEHHSHIATGVELCVRDGSIDELETAGGRDLLQAEGGLELASGDPEVPVDRTELDDRVLDTASAFSAGSTEIDLEQVPKPRPERSAAQRQPQAGHIELAERAVVSI